MVAKELLEETGLFLLEGLHSELALEFIQGIYHGLGLHSLMDKPRDFSSTKVICFSNQSRIVKEGTFDWSAKHEQLNRTLDTQADEPLEFNEPVVLAHKGSECFRDGSFKLKAIRRNSFRFKI